MSLLFSSKPEGVRCAGFECDTAVLCRCNTVGTVVLCGKYYGILREVLQYYADSTAVLYGKYCSVVPVIPVAYLGIERRMTPSGTSRHGVIRVNETPSRRHLGLGWSGRQCCFPCTLVAAAGCTRE